MERLKLNVPTAIPQKVHHELEVCLGCNVPRHDAVVCAVEEDLAEELKRLALGDIVVRHDQDIVHCKEPVVVLVQVCRDHGFVLCESFLDVSGRC